MSNLSPLCFTDCLTSFLSLLRIFARSISYPIAYSIVILPVSVVRWISFSGGHPPDAATFASIFLHGMFGAVNVVLLLTTRPNLLLFGGPRRSRFAGQNLRVGAGTDRRDQSSTRSLSAPPHFTETERPRETRGIRSPGSETGRSRNETEEEGRGTFVRNPRGKRRTTERKGRQGYGDGMLK